MANISKLIVTACIYKIFETMEDQPAYIYIYTHTHSSISHYGRCWP